MEDFYTKEFFHLLKTLNIFSENRAYIFRGHSDYSWPLIPKSGREEYSKCYTTSFDDTVVFKAWKRYALHYIAKEPLNEWDWLTLAQHYGLATRLLDWTKNPLNAIYFAVSENFDKDGSIYVTKTYGKDIIKEEKDPFNITGFKIYFPSGISSRIISQRGLFTISSKHNEALEKQFPTRFKRIIIDKSSKKEILSQLEFYGINKASIYQDLDSLSEYLNDYLKNILPSSNKKIIIDKDLLS